MTSQTAEFSTRQHGNYAKYVVEKCRCEDCGVANREYGRSRSRRKAYGDKWWGWVDAEPARQHVLALLPSRYRGARDGIGLKRIVELSGVSHGSLSKLIYGGPGDRGPSKRILTKNARKLLSIRPVDENIAPRGFVEAEVVWRMVEEIVAFGVPKAKISRAMGKGDGLQLNQRGYVEAKNARLVADLHWRLFENAPMFRAFCTCHPPYDVLDRLEAQPDNWHPWTPHSEWEYPDAHHAKSVAARATRGTPQSPIRAVVTDEDGVIRWYPGAEYAPDSSGAFSVKILAVLTEKGEWG